MSNVLNLLSEETFAEKMDTQNSLLAAIASQNGGIGITSWADVQKIVRMGIAPVIFPVGYEFSITGSDTETDIVWVVRGHNHHAAASNTLKHTMTLETKYVYSQASGSYKNLQFDAPEALYYAADGLTAGTYNFTWNYASSAIVSGTYQFTLTQAVPAGGQIVLGTNSNSTAITSCKIATYGSVGDTTAIESGIVVTEGSEGTSLGTTGTGYLNHPHRVLWGSNNYAQSAARQWLNSTAAAGAVWSAQNMFDRRPSWYSSYNGFMHGLPADFLAAVQSAVIPCRTNGVYECNSLDGTEFVINQVYDLEDKFFLLSRPEIYGAWDSTSYKDGELLEYYDGLTNTERKKYDVAGSVRYAWLRSPYLSYASYERFVNPDGTVSYYNAYNSYGVAPACIIA